MSSDDVKPPASDSSADQWVRTTRLFRKWEDMKQEIQLHKWYESEKAGYDIGWERATVDWMIRHGCKDPRKTSS